MRGVRAWLDAHPAPKAQARPAGIDISYSQMRTYMECPWLYKIIYVDRKRPPPTPASSLGVSIHRALEAFHREDGSSKDRLLELYDERWVHAGFATASEQLEWHRKGLKVLATYWADEEERRSRIEAVERDFLFELGPHRVRGTIDRIDRRPDGTTEIIDYKTHLDFESEDEAAQNLQLGIYGLGAAQSLGLTPAWLTLYYVAAGKRVTVPFDPAREGELKELTLRVADLIASGRGFRPDTDWCPSCVFRKVCAHSVSRS